MQSPAKSIKKIESLKQFSLNNYLYFLQLSEVNENARVGLTKQYNQCENVYGSDSRSELFCFSMYEQLTQVKVMRPQLIHMLRKM